MARKKGKGRKAGDKLQQFKRQLKKTDSSASGAGSGKGGKRFSGKDVRQANKAGKKLGVSKAERRAAINAHVEKAKSKGVKTGGRTEAALARLNREKPNTAPQSTPVTPEPTAVTTPTPTPTPTSNPAPTETYISAPTPEPAAPAPAQVTARQKATAHLGSSAPARRENRFR